VVEDLAMSDQDERITQNLRAADKALKMTPEERDLYMRHLVNLWSDDGVDNPDGSRSTLYQTVMKHDGKYYNVPSVWEGKKLTGADGKPDDAAIRQKVEETGWHHFPAYDDPDAADARYEQMHGHMERDTADYMAVRSGPLELAPGLINATEP
jgi:hypothetical protein